MGELEKRGAEVTFAAVAQAANVSRDFLYGHAEPSPIPVRRND
jgi:hypothetical protein